MNQGKRKKNKILMNSSSSMIFARVLLGTVPFSQVQGHLFYCHENLFMFLGVLNPEELFETLNIIPGDKGHKEPCGLPSESMAASRIGVLNPEELSLVNNRKSETVTHILPGVEQEFWKSTESNSTLDSDYSLSSLEIDLFDDMRASMEKSSKSSNFVNSSCKLQSQTDTPNPHFSKRLDTTSTRAKPFSASRRPKSNADAVGKTAKEAINPSKAQHGTRAGEHEPSSSLKLSKAYDEANPFSSGAAKRASISANQMKVNYKIRKALSGQNRSKKPCVGDRGTPSEEPSSSRSLIVSKDLSGSVCGQSPSIVKPPSSLRRNNDSASSDSDAWTPTKTLTQHKSKLIDTSQPTSLQSKPSASLLTSVGCWSYESSSYLNHVDASQCSDTENCSNDQLPSTFLREIKPSGLRLPSPKIGFFEVENSRELALNGVKFHSGLQNSSKTRSGTNHLYGTPNRERSSKLQSPRTATLKEKKLGSQRNGTQFSRDNKLNCAAKLEGEKAGTIKSSTATTFMAETDPSWESSNEFVSITDSDKGKIQPKRKQHVSQIGEKIYRHQNEKIIAVNRDEKENSSSFKSQMDVLTKQIEAIDVN
ncbi:hypothetical protein F3Y22_tig00110482pilonHSYRG00365 [Hibiscus syriacus]|uniref:Uncharacterized protein n=1 Tax=Hibiscus syriacus TaxID=106335 RepID=A0A6A3AFI1_HIBSY|nr:hypothetical protein F3Y22_tig00110482pilonHSYRG00365 [Hibiscus syriacus]